jgi:hypothetical protein
MLQAPPQVQGHAEVRGASQACGAPNRLESSPTRTGDEARAVHCAIRSRASVHSCQQPKVNQSVDEHLPAFNLISTLDLDHRSDLHQRRCPPAEFCSLRCCCHQIPPSRTAAPRSTPICSDSVSKGPANLCSSAAASSSQPFSPDSPKTFETRRRSSIRLTCPTHYRWVTCQLPAHII